MKTRGPLLLVVGVALLCFVFQGKAWARIWHDKRGRQVDADFVESRDGTVRLKRTSDGKTFDIPIKMLSEDDREFIRKQAAIQASSATPSDAPPQSQQIEKSAAETDTIADAEVTRPIENVSPHRTSSAGPKQNGAVDGARPIASPTASKLEDLAHQFIPYVFSPTGYAIGIGIVTTCAILMIVRRRASPATGNVRFDPIPADSSASVASAVKSTRTASEYVTADNPLRVWNKAKFYLETNPDLGAMLASHSPPMPFRREEASHGKWQNETLDRRRATLVAAYMRHPNALVRAAAAKLSVAYRGLAVESYLVDLLADKEHSVSRSAAQVIWEREGCEYCETSIKHLRDEIRGHVNNFGQTTSEGLRLDRGQAIAGIDNIIDAAPDADARSKVKQLIDKHVIIEEKIQPGKSASVKPKGTERNGPYTYEVYQADSKQDALAFLKCKSVTKEKYYIEVETPEGSFGRDIQGMYDV